MFMNKKIVIVLLSLSMPVLSMDTKVTSDGQLTINISVLSSSFSTQDSVSPLSLTSSASHSSSSQASASQKTSCKRCLLEQASKVAAEKSWEFLERKRIQHYEDAVHAKNKIINELEFQIIGHQHLYRELKGKSDILQADNYELRKSIESLQERLMAGMQERLSQQSAQASTDNSARSSSSTFTETHAPLNKRHLRLSSSSSSSSLVSGQSTRVRKSVRSQAKKDNLQQAALHSDDEFMKLASQVADPSSSQSKKRSKLEEN